LYEFGWCGCTPSCEKCGKECDPEANWPETNENGKIVCGFQCIVDTTCYAGVYLHPSALVSGAWIDYHEEGCYEECGLTGTCVTIKTPNDEEHVCIYPPLIFGFNDNVVIHNKTVDDIAMIKPAR
jgi:hypothetical protein